jgi:STE24 endopeptidase
MIAFVIALFIALFIAKLAAQLWLEHLNRRNVLAHADHIPDTFKAFMDAPTYRKSVDYTLAKSRLHKVELIYDTVLLLVVLFSGFLPFLEHFFTHHHGNSVWTKAAFLFTTGILLAIPSLPFDWHSQFRLEERFGFNTTTQKLWWLDRIKGLLLAVVIGYPLLVLILKLVEWTGTLWWLWAWLVLVAFQLLMVVIAPILILPIFNKLTPLPEGSLRERLLKLAAKTDFQAASIQVMDGSKRSRHSNAFFTGFKRFRKIVLFDTLVQQLTEPEIEAVLAHEIGHYKKAHIPKTLAWSTLTTLGGFYVIAVLAKQAWFYHAFGFQEPSVTVALLLFSLLSGAFTFWFSPLAHWWSRKFEYEADAFAAQIMNEASSLIGALRKLSEKNLSNLTPHPFYSGFYYSHPTLLERENALKKVGTVLPSKG